MSIKSFRTRFFMAAAGTLMLVAVVLGVLLAAPANAWADFTVYVGYSGGPYYEKIRYSDSEMRAMSDAKLYEYTAFDSMPALRKGFAYGVRIESLFSNAGISSSELKRFYFSTQDGYIADDGVEGYGAWTYSALVGTTRYYFPNLINTYDFEEQEITDYDESWEGAVSVPAVLAYSSSFGRVFSAEDSAWTSTSHMSSAGYQLMFGQTNPATADARAFAGVVKAMTCIFNGTPELSFSTDESGNLFEAKVGETITIQAPTIDAADPLIEQNAKYDFDWTVSDTGIADFVRDENGNVIIAEDGSVQLEIYAEGDVSVSASYGNSPSSEYRTTATAGGKGTGSGSGEGEGDGADDSGKGTGGGTGTGDGADDEDGDEVAFNAGGEVATNVTPAQTQSEAGGDSDTGNEGGSASAQAWKVSSKGSQTAMVDDILFGSPMAVAIAIFACFVCGYVGRVILTEKQKDPYVEARLRQQYARGKE